jgi:cation diffusion facilitator family transporter
MNRPEQDETGKSIVMTDQDCFSCPHEHDFLADRHRVNERRTQFVIALTAAAMIVEILAGIAYGSMALLADGWHMASHVCALGLTALAYYLARKYRRNPKFTFGTGKIGDLAGYSSAMLLAVIAVLMAYESLQRLLDPVTIRFNEAILVAVFGLVVNLLSALILKEHPDSHRHPDHGAHHHHLDHNLRAAYLHVLADSLTSLLAIVALVGGKIWGWAVLDPIMGIVGAAVITRWSWTLLRDSGRVLLDQTTDRWIADQIRERLTSAGDVTIEDFHLWRVGAGHFSAIISLTSSGKWGPRDYKNLLRGISGLSHVTIEVNHRAGS